APDCSRRQIEMQILDGGAYDSEAGVDRDPVLRIGNVESQSLGAPGIETAIVDAAECGRLEAPYAYVEDAGRIFANATLPGWLWVPEGTVVPLTLTAAPETGTEIVTEIGSFTWTSGGAPEDVCGTDEDDDETAPPPADGDDGDDDGEDPTA